MLSMVKSLLYKKEFETMDLSFIMYGDYNIFFKHNFSLSFTINSLKALLRFFSILSYTWYYTAIHKSNKKVHHTHLFSKSKCQI